MKNQNYNFWTLVNYEFKKLLQKKIVLITLIILLLVNIISYMSVFFTSSTMVYVETDGKGQQAVESLSGFEIMKRQIEYARALDGKVINASLILEAEEDFKQNPLQLVRKYEAVYDIAGTVLERGTDWTKSASDFYTLWRQSVADVMEEQHLTQKETAYWEKKLDTIETPFTYRYAMAYENVLGYMLTLGVTVLLLNAICLAGVFSDEHQKKTDQLILCMKNGKNPVYFAKMTAGVFFSTGTALLAFVIAMGFSFGFYGTEGFHAMLQMIIVQAPFSLTAGEAVLVMFGILMLSAVLESVLVLMLSEIFKNPVGVMAVMVGLMILSQITVPESWRVLSQALALLPTALTAAWSFADFCLVKLGGIYLTNFAFAAVVYPLLTGIFVLCGKRSYNRYQDGAK